MLLLLLLLQCHCKLEEVPRSRSSVERETSYDTHTTDDQQATVAGLFLEFNKPHSYHHHMYDCCFAGTNGCGGLRSTTSGRDRGIESVRTDTEPEPVDSNQRV